MVARNMAMIVPRPLHPRYETQAPISDAGAEDPPQHETATPWPPESKAVGVSAPASDRWSDAGEDRFAGIATPSPLLEELGASQGRDARAPDLADRGRQDPNVGAGEPVAPKDEDGPP